MPWLLNSGSVLASTKRVSILRGVWLLSIGPSEVVVARATRLPAIATFQRPGFVLVLDREMKVLSLATLRPWHFSRVPTKMYWLVIAPPEISSTWGVRVGDQLELVESRRSE